MSFEIPVHHVDQFKGNVSMLSQQKASKLVPLVRHETLNGKKAAFDFIGATQTNRRRGRHADTKLVNTPHSRRWVQGVTEDWADLIDDVDKLKMLYDPKNPYARNAAYAFARAKDDLIIEAAIGDCYAGEEGDTLVDWSTYTDQIIVHGSAGLTLAKLQSMREQKEASDVNPELPWYFVVSPKQVTNLLGTTEVKSADYNTVKALAAGEINSFMGFQFIIHNRLPVTGTARRCFAFCGGGDEAGILLATSADIMTDIGPRRDKNNSTQVFMTMTMGAVRMEEVKVIECQCTES